MIVFYIFHHGEKYRTTALRRLTSNYRLTDIQISAIFNLVPRLFPLRSWKLARVITSKSVVKNSVLPFSYPEPFLRAVNGARQGALAKSISNWHLIGYNEGYCSNNVYIFYHVFMVSGFGFGQSPSSHRA